MLVELDPLPPPPKLEAPPPPFIPPPEVVITQPPPPAPTITATPTPPPAAVEITPVAPTAPPAAPGPVSIRVVCPTQVQPTMPRKALQENISGSVTVRARIKGGKVIAVEIIKSQPRGLFDNAVRSAMSQYQCAASGDQEIVAIQEFQFTVNE